MHMYGQFYAVHKPLEGGVQTIKYNISSNLFKCARNGSLYVWKWKVRFGFNKAKTIGFAKNFEPLRMRKGASFRCSFQFPTFHLYIHPGITLRVPAITDSVT